MSSHKSLHKFTGHSSSITNLAFTSDGKYLLSTGAADRTVCMWDCNTATELKNAVQGKPFFFNLKNYITNIQH